ncbi:hypothetical protein KIL84_003026 [Mauremys mutica]|uniref:Uncharacterized protein n=1 Tax=Mauremys mutica TaxID=74926 RepID=A0A9D3WUE4_9SAUR|nr:hypothetical protein KIL84_003026 [Mauremys mutica]
MSVIMGKWLVKNASNDGNTPIADISDGISLAPLSNSNNENYTTSENIVTIGQQLDHEVTTSPSVSITDNDETLDTFDIMAKTTVIGRNQQHNSSTRQIIEINFNDPMIHHLGPV